MEKVYEKMFGWLCIGLLITFVSGYCLSLNETLLYNLLTVGIIPIIIVEFGIAIFLGMRIKKMNPITAKICYIIYSVVTGVTFGTIFLAYELNSVISVFGVTGIIFALLALYGYTTKKDITKIGNILFFMLIGIVLVSIVNIFIGSSGVELGLSVLTLIVFMGYVIYDVNTVKYYLTTLDEDKAAIYGAFQLYLDFINIFIELLRFFGKRKD